MAIPDAVIAPSGLHVNAMALGALGGAQKELIPWNEHAIRGRGGHPESGEEAFALA